MFTNLIRRLTEPEPGRLPEPDERLAVAGLLVRIARTDHDYAEAEIRQIDALLARRYGMSPFEAAKLRGEAEALEAEAPDTVRFTRAIKDAVPLEEREAVIEAAWAVALADGQRDTDETSLMRLVARMLGIDDTASNRIRKGLED
ncbi:TerB family tellurite resistance protein [Pseudoroseicyclus tamaricis]|uniref:TerB family tellurite resistance protein n=1 Tax=Pseudoroseicyclus tamaricis TaxID=2705421 RepID=A0A6B2JT04_9RHOB|nr:TerB family tellurite resistance protein [Pseudoroseicyclus tamaricis]NDV01687.1 TerB family tellurite resistance protein [Pseudoroseicyclus tamaricis]